MSLRSSLVAALAVAAAVLSLLATTRQHHDGGRLEITVDAGGRAPLELAWDSGDGFNQRERTVLVFGRVLPGRDTRILPLPHTPIEGLEAVALDPSVELEVQAVRFVIGEQTVDLDAGTSGGDGATLRWTDLEIPTRSFSALLLVVQILVSLCVGGASLVVMRLPSLIGRPDWRSAWRFLVREDDRWMWWAMFAGSAAVFFFWLAGQWPGAMQNDSFTAWVQLKTLKIDNMLPWIYTLWLLALTQLADSPAVVGTVQVLISATLGSSIFYYCLRRGVARPVVFLFWLLFTFSIPVGLYNVTHFKDVPFAQCTLLWAFILYRLWLHREDGRRWNPKSMTVVIMSILLMGFLTRHNGFLFVAAIPVVVLLCGLMPRRRAMLFVAVSWSIFAFLQVAVANFIGVHARTSYPRLEAWMKAAPVFGLFANAGGYHTDDPRGDRRRVEQLVAVETIRREYQRGSFAPIFYRHRSDDAEEAYRQLGIVFDRRVADNLPILVSDKAYLFTTVIGPFRKAYLWSNDLHDRRFLERGVWVNRRYVRHWSENMTLLHRLAHRPLWSGAYRLQRRLWGQSKDFEGLTRGRFVLWNALLPFALLVSGLAASRWLPATALFASVVLFQVPFVFLAATAYHYRFIFFIVYAGFFVIPLALAESRIKPGPVRPG